MNAAINDILSNDDELFNRVIALGPGGGINRWEVVLEDATSISSYGVRETVEEFPDAVNISDLEAKATTFLEAHKEPRQEISVTYYFSTETELDPLRYGGEVIIIVGGEEVLYLTAGNANELRRGDTVRIVSRDLGQTFTGIVQELDWQPGEVTLLIGQPSYNLLDVINGPEEEEERKKVALGLPTPIGFVAYTTLPGVTVRLNPYTNSRAVGVEIYASQTSGFTADRGKLLLRGSGTSFYFPDLEQNTLYYFRALAYDSEGNVSDLTEEISALSGQPPAPPDSSIDITKFASDIRPPRYVSPLPTVPSVPGYQVGDIVILSDDMKLYRLETTTNTPATDWVPVVRVADLEGEITAANIQAGSITGDRIVGNDITAAQISAGAIGASEIAAQAITASKMAIGDFTNLIRNPGFEDADISTQPVEYPSRGTATRDATTKHGGEYSLRYDHTDPITSGQRIGFHGAISDSPVNMIPVKVGDKFSLSFWYRDGAVAPSPTPRIYVAGYDHLGSLLLGATSLDKIGSGLDSSGFLTTRSTTWTEYTLEFSVTSSTASYVMVTFIPSSIQDGQSFYLDDLTLRRMSGGELIVDGEITTDKLAANSVTAGKIAAGEVTTGKLAAGHVIIDDGAGGDGDADRLRVNTVAGGGGTDQVVLGDISTETNGAASWGLWGALGSGVFIEGAPRFIAFGIASDLLMIVLSSFSAGAFWTGMTDTESVLINGSTSFTVPTGKKWVAVTSFSSVIGPLPFLLRFSETSAFRATNSSSTIVVNEFPAGSYTGAQVYARYDLYAVEAGPAWSLSPEVNYIIFEVDA